jgi:hypothetical protein
MNATIGWILAVLAIAIGYTVYGWPGVALAVSVLVFWLLLQFTRAMRVMRAAGQAPVGHVASAVMLQAKLRPGLRLLELITLTKSLGEKLADDPETYRWTDPGGASVTTELRGGRLAEWRFARPDEPAQSAPEAGA